MINSLGRVKQLFNVDAFLNSIKNFQQLFSMQSMTVELMKVKE